MSIDREWLDYHRRNVWKAEQDYADAVEDEFPIGMAVEYQLGQYWIGPCEVVAIIGRSKAGYLMVRNPRTGKTREVWCNSVREANGGTA